MRKVVTHGNITTIPLFRFDLPDNVLSTRTISLFRCSTPYPLFRYGAIEGPLIQLIFATCSENVRPMHMEKKMVAIFEPMRREFRGVVDSEFKPLSELVLDFGLESGEPLMLTLRL